jgi:hypothetical protein
MIAVGGTDVCIRLLVNLRKFYRGAMYSWIVLCGEGKRIDAQTFPNGDGGELH